MYHTSGPARQTCVLFDGWDSIIRPMVSGSLAYMALAVMLRCQAKERSQN
jgi:hypothetical protein